jgi:hypothetical protein
MKDHFVRTTVFALLIGLGGGIRAAQAQVCVQIDRAQDTLNEEDQRAAVLLLNRQFALAGEEVAADCPAPYLLAHVKLGTVITVTLSGPKGERTGTALGLDDLPALYSQMVRSLETGRPLAGFGIVDRTNVTAAQSTAQRVHSDGFSYARLGYGGIFAERAYGVPSFGFGYRAELDRMAIDVSFLNLQPSNFDYASSSPRASSNSFIKLSGLYMLNRTANSTPYIGAGLSWGRTSIDRNMPVPVEAPGRSNVTNATYPAFGHGSGLQGELNVGYELARATTIRVFVQADAVLPFYSVTTETFSSRGLMVSSGRRYTPSLVMSVGLGWQRNRKGP